VKWFVNWTLLDFGFWVLGSRLVVTGKQTIRTNRISGSAGTNNIKKRFLAGNADPKMRYCDFARDLLTVGGDENVSRK
jgi:hypothetical protein